MKRLLLVLVLLMTAGSLFAAELKVDGKGMVRGTYWSFDEDAATDKATFAMFDYDFVINTAFVANEKATVFTRLTFDRDVVGSGYVANGNGTLVEETSNDADLTALGSVEKGEPGSYALNVERAYLNYKFAPFLQLNTGLMGGGQWATEFGNTEANVMRVQFIGALSKDMIFIATYEKRNESGPLSMDSTAGFDVSDAEKGDVTVYYLSSILKFDAITVMPLLVYGTQGIGYDLDLSAGAALGVKKNYDATTMAAQLGVKGDFGMFGFESEFQYQKKDTDGLYKDLLAADVILTGLGAPNAGIGAEIIETLDLKDSKTYGAYINVFAKIDAIKAGLIYVYGSADDKDGSRFNNGADFNPLVYMLDWESANGFSVYAVYGNYTMDKLTVGAAIAYGASNMKNDDASFMEYDLTASYAFDANTTYDVGFAYVQQTDWESAGDDWTVMRLYHAMTIKF